MHVEEVTIDYLADLNEAREHTLEEITMLEDAVRREGVTIPGARGNIVSHTASNVAPGMPNCD
jgi:hypothetical protein